MRVFFARTPVLRCHPHAQGQSGSAFVSVAKRLGQAASCFRRVAIVSYCFLQWAHTLFLSSSPVHLASWAVRAFQTFAFPRICDMVVSSVRIAGPAIHVFSCAPQILASWKKAPTFSALSWCWWEHVCGVLPIVWSVLPLVCIGEPVGFFVACMVGVSLNPLPFDVVCGSKSPVDLLTFLG